MTVREAVLDWIAPRVTTTETSAPAGAVTEGVTEAGRAVPVQPSQGEWVARLGVDPDVPLGGSSRLNAGGDYPDGRQAFMTSLYGAYVTCPWVSAPIDVIARTVTGGGIEIAPTDDAGQGETPAKPPPAVMALQKLLDYCNPAQDIVQLCRGGITDLGIYGDAFIEVIWLLGLPVALYPLDPATMIVCADENGQVTGYDQVVDTRGKHFEMHEVIHISMDSPRGSLYGMGIAQKALLDAQVWLFTTALIQERMRKGDPPNLHLDWPLEVQVGEIRAWRQDYRTKNLGIDNIGVPVTTRGGATPNELQAGRLTELLALRDSARDTCLSVAGVPPAKAGVIESGNLGGGTGDSQEKTFKTNTCGPMAAIFLEKINYALTVMAFGISGWAVRFRDVDLRDDEVVDKLRDMRIRNGSYTLNDALAEMGKPTIGPEGDVHALITTKEILTWDQVQAFADAAVAAIVAKTDATTATADAAKTHADAAKLAAANGLPPPPPGGLPGPPAANSPIPPTPPADDGSGDAEPKETATPDWRARVTEHYRRLVAGNV